MTLLVLVYLVASAIAAGFVVLGFARGRRFQSRVTIALISLILGSAIGLLVFSFLAQPPAGRLGQSFPSPSGDREIRLYYVDDYGLGPESAILLVKVTSPSGNERTILIDSASNGTDRRVTWIDGTHVAYVDESGGKVTLDVATAAAKHLQPDDLDRLKAGLVGGITSAAVSAVFALAAVVVSGRRKRAEPSPTEASHPDPLL